MVHGEAFFRAGVNAGGANNAAIWINRPRFAGFLDGQRIGRAFSGAKAAKNARRDVNFDMPARLLEIGAFDCRIHPRGGRPEQILENIH